MLDPNNPLEYIETKDGIEDLIDNSGLDAEPYYFQDRGDGQPGWGLKYNGINALQYYDKDMFHPEYKNIVIFKGKYLGSNVFGDGDTVKPNEIVAIINRT